MPIKLVLKADQIGVKGTGTVKNITQTNTNIVKTSKQQANIKLKAQTKPSSQQSNSSTLFNRNKYRSNNFVSSESEFVLSLS